ncbi:hypothetical protein D3874_15200 [Oleomonas cavernae]|uniref:DUF2135 domain-containing protein n=1 Tax=Oleomonas cavernae TaxID=2320859 RepID=A0A418WDZ7_9PROT|nr:hypothetical protein [Oleomonas cavernae]RJF88196.1 hypothetical protein D3874_15200 [Oleomonas cavernae]
MQVILAWDDANDVDVHVVCPNGTRIYWDHPNGCGGDLDIDHNRYDDRVIMDPVENVVWLDDPPPGQYRIEVQLPKSRGIPRSHYRITLRRAGKPDQVFEGSVDQARNRNDTKIVHVFNVP